MDLIRASLNAVPEIADQPCVSSAYRALYPSAVGLFRPSGPIISLSATKTKLSKVHESTGPANRLRTREGTVPASTGFHEYQAQNPAGHPVSRFGDSQKRDDTL